MDWSWRKWFRVIHRDFGYLFFAVTLIYSISGIALNHLDDWNPNFIITTREIQVEDMSLLTEEITEKSILTILEPYDMDEFYKNYYYPQPGLIKIFLHGGSCVIDMETGKGLIERSVRRPLFREMNYLHYNPIRYWTWFSDLYAGALILIAITGIFLVRGKQGMSGRGAWLTILGFVIPIVFLIIYFYNSVE